MSSALGRILAWMLDARTMARVGMRVHVAAQKIRPDLVNGMSMRQIAEPFGVGRSRVHNLAKEFERAFGFHGPYYRGGPGVARRLSIAYRRKRNDKKATDLKLPRLESHLCFVNRFAAWRAGAIFSGPAAQGHVEQAIKDLGPVIDWLIQQGAVAECPAKKTTARV
jgi:hypothetical protein